MQTVKFIVSPLRFREVSTLERI